MTSPVNASFYDGASEVEIRSDAVQKNYSQQSYRFGLDKRLRGESRTYV
jgi:hypothetical protein